MPWLFINILAFSWAIGLCAAAMFATLAVLESRAGKLEPAIGLEPMTC